MAQKKKTTKKTRKSKAKKPKVYIPAYKIIISCAVIITLCMGLLLVSTIMQSSPQETDSINRQFTEKTEDVKNQTEKQADEEKRAEQKKADNQNGTSKSQGSEKKEAAVTKKDPPKETKKAEQKTEPTTKTEPKKEPPKQATQTKSEPLPAPAPSPKQEPAPKPAEPQKKSEAQNTAPAPAPTTRPATPEPKPASKYNFPQAKNGATIVIVIDDAGRSAENTKKYTDLPFPITIAVLPRLPQTRQCAAAVRNAGKELILHQPMQAMNLAMDPGEGAIKEDMTRAEISAVIRENVAELGGGVKGMNNHEGSLITADEVKIGIVLDTCMDMGIYFLDSRTTAETRAPQAALERDFEIFEKAGPYLDNDIDREKMLSRLRESLDYANRHGKAIVIGHVDKSVKILPALLADAYPEMKAAGYRFATPSMLR